MKYTDEELLYKLELDLTGARANNSEVVAQVDDWGFEIYGKYSTGETGGLSTREKSTIIMKDLLRVVEGSIPSLSDPFLSDSDIVGVQSRNAQGVEKARIIQQLLNKQFSKSKNVVSLIEDISRVIQEEGTVFVQSGWGNDSATVERVSIRSLLIDPSAEKMEDAKYVIKRVKVSIGDILANPDWYGKHTFEDLQKLMPTNDSDYDDAAEIGRDTSFNFDDKAREMVELFEYYGVMDIDGNGKLVPVLAIWSGASNKILKFGDSPYPESWNGNPFDSAQYISRTGSIYGSGIADLIGDYQKVRSGFMREVLNNANKANSSQTAVKKGTLDIANKRKFLRGEDYEYLGEPGIISAQFNPVPESIFAMMESMKVEQEELSGISRQNAGIDPRSLNNKTATAVNTAQSNAEKRLLQIVRHISAMFEGVFRKWIDLNQEYLQEGIADVPATNQMNPMNGMENFQQARMAQSMDPQTISVNGMMIDGNFDVELQVGTTGMKTSQNENILLMLTQMSPYSQQIGMSSSMNLLAKLSDNLDMPQLAQTLRQKSNMMKEQESQPQEMAPEQQLAIATAEADIAKTQSEIQKNNATAMKDQSAAVQNHVETELATYGQENL